MYPNTYSIITATTIESNLSNTAWYMMRHQLRPDLCISTGQVREHLTEPSNEQRAKKGCHGRWTKLVEVVSLSLSLSLFLSLSLSVLSLDFMFHFQKIRRDSCLVCLNCSYGPEHEIMLKATLSTLTLTQKNNILGTCVPTMTCQKLCHEVMNQSTTFNSLFEGFR